MGYSPMSPLASGTFADFETINRLISNIASIRQETPRMNYVTGKGVKYDSRSTPMRLQGGQLLVYNLKGTKDYVVKLPVGGRGTPIVTYGISGTSNVRANTMKHTASTFTVRFVPANPKTSYTFSFFWHALTLDNV